MRGTREVLLLRDGDEVVELGKAHISNIDERRENPKASECFIPKRYGRGAVHAFMLTES